LLGTVDVDDERRVEVDPTGVDPGRTGREYRCQSRTTERIKSTSVDRPGKNASLIRTA
jgi:hypothetical protein